MILKSIDSIKEKKKKKQQFLWGRFPCSGSYRNAPSSLESLGGPHCVPERFSIQSLNELSKSGLKCHHQPEWRQLPHYSAALGNPEVEKVLISNMELPEKLTKN